MDDSQPRSSLDFLAWALGRCHADRVTGSLYLGGRPGGVFHLREGAVVAVDSPGAPGPDALLLRSGRISQADWSAVLRADGTAPGAGLLARAGIGGTELRLIVTAAAHDGAFAVAAGTIEEYAIDPRPLDVPLPVNPGIDPDRLLDEVTRRGNALASLATPVAPHRERVAPAPGTDPPPDVLSAARREIVAAANGRRCARDIAFLLGRNVFPVTVEVSRLVADGLLAVVSGASPGRSGPVRSLRPRSRPPDPPPDAPAPGEVPLPQRTPGASGVSDTGSAPRASGWQALPRLLSRIRAGPGRRDNHDIADGKEATRGT